MVLKGTISALDMTDQHGTWIASVRDEDRFYPRR
jgi:hypothetical protein